MSPYYSLWLNLTCGHDSWIVTGLHSTLLHRRCLCTEKVNACESKPARMYFYTPSLFSYFFGTSPAVHVPNNHTFEDCARSRPPSSNSTSHSLQSFFYICFEFFFTWFAFPLFHVFDGNGGSLPRLLFITHETKKASPWNGYFSPKVTAQPTSSTTHCRVVNIAGAQALCTRERRLQPWMLLRWDGWSVFLKR